MAVMKGIYRIVSLFALTIFLSGMFAGCDRSSDGLRREPEPLGPGANNEPVPGGGYRPGLETDPSDFAAEFADSTLRYAGGGNVLRYDRGGVLFKVLPDGVREIVDIDKGLRIEVRPGSMRADSVYPDASVTVGDEALAVRSFRMKKQTAGAVWYHLVDRDSANYVLVLP